MSKLNVYAWTKPGVPNFGDELGPDILYRLGHTVTRVPIERADVIVCGSVLEKTVKAPDGCVIAGAGIMRPGDVDVSRFDVRAVRGRLSQAACVGIRQGMLALGDPGILAGLLYQTGPCVAGRVGVVPHYVDDRTFPWADVVIDVLQPPADVVYEISRCSYIMSSSLHGLVVAQSLGIPAQRLPHHRVGGGDTKWIDHATGLHSGGSMHETKQRIYDVLENL